MSADLPHNPSDLLDAYLDGSLTGDRLAAFERALKTDAGLRRDAELHQKMTGALRRHFVPPPGLSVPTPAPQPVEAPAGGAPVGPAPVLARVGVRTELWKRVIVYGVAASLAVAGAWWYTDWQDRRITSVSRHISADALYDKLVANGFTPEWKCKDDAEFAQTVRDRLGQPLLVAAAVPGLDVLGWAYMSAYDGSPLSDQAMILMCRVDSQNVIVLLDRTEEDCHLDLSSTAKLTAERRTIGSLVAYEVSPIKSTRVIDALYIPKD